MAQYNCKNNKKTPNYYWGIGLSKTGLTTLTRAFGKLGYKAVQGMRMRTYRRQLDTLDFGCAVPITNNYVDVDKRIPGSKFIFTDRNIDTWLESCERFWNLVINYKGISLRQRTRHFKEFGIVRFDKDIFVSVFKRHKYAVYEYFKNRPKDLYTMRICDGEGDGWNALCGILGEEIPDIPWPWLRKKQGDGIPILPYLKGEERHPV
ncbi:hypothetical protein GF395_04280 [Candidatus Uhrbacteria bacterium]|nr:hypothetical protein [Candidatus Uhrbacteria bacterium]